MILMMWMKPGIIWDDMFEHTYQSIKGPATTGVQYHPTDRDTQWTLIRQCCHHLLDLDLKGGESCGHSLPGSRAGQTYTFEINQILRIGILLE